MKTKLVILLALVLAVIIGLAVLVMRHSQHERTQPSDEDSRAVRKSSGEFLVPDTGNDVLSDINKKSATTPKASPTAIPAP